MQYSGAPCGVSSLKTSLEIQVRCGAISCLAIPSQIATNAAQWCLSCFALFTHDHCHKTADSVLTRLDKLLSVWRAHALACFFIERCKTSLIHRSIRPYTPILLPVESLPQLKKQAIHGSPLLGYTYPERGGFYRQSNRQKHTRFL